MRISIILSLISLLFWACDDDGGTPSAGSVGGPCYGDGTCDEGLECHSDLCVVPNGNNTNNAQSVCGNGLIELGEQCDGPNMAGLTCATLGYVSGELSCTSDSCVLDTSACMHCGPDGTPCSTGNLCVSDETCQNDVCTGTVKDCSHITPPDECHMAMCNEATGNCDLMAANEGEPCDDVEDPCQIGGACMAGMCVGLGEMDCSGLDGVCVQGVCDPETGTCSTEPLGDGTPCVSEDLCQANASCQTGMCVGTVKDCTFSPLAQCNQVSCNPATGNCEGTPDSDKDGLACVDYSDPCIIDRTCDTGACSGGTPRDCSHLDVGCEQGVCETATGNCVLEQAPPGASCDEATDSCNDGVCDASGLCVAHPKADDTPCSDGNSCTSDDLCSQGTCEGTAVPGCTRYLEESFDLGCPPVGWTLMGGWACGTPTESSEPQSLPSEPACAGTVIGGNYLDFQGWDFATMDTPSIDLSGATAPVLTFWVWFDTEGATYDGANVKISIDGGTTFTLLDTDLPYTLTVGGEPAWGGHMSAAGWRMVRADLTSYAGQTVRLRFAFRSDGSGNYAGVYIDDVVVTEWSTLPIHITTDSDLEYAYADNAFSRQMESDATVPLSWSIVGGSNHGWLTIDATSGLLSGTPGLGDLGTVQVDVRAEETGNASLFAEKTFTLEVSEMLLSWDFEDACPGDWTFGESWECGIPTSGPGSAYSGTQCIATGLTANYPVYMEWATSTVTSPSIDLAGAVNPVLSFEMWLYTEGSSYDGVNLLVSTDGVVFVLLETDKPYTNLIDTQQAWGGNESTLGWQHVEADLSAYAGTTIYLRFAARSDGSAQYAGAYIDDVVVRE